MQLTSKEIKLLRILAKNGEVSIADIVEEVNTETIDTLEEKGLIKKIFNGKHYWEDRYAITGISDEWEECLQELFRKLN